MFFNKKIKTSLSEFISELNSGNEDVLHILGLRESSFHIVPYEQIIDNPADIVSGVIGVKTKFNIKAFDLFNNMLIKEYNDGGVKHIFYTTTKDFMKIDEITETVYSILGEGYCNTEIHSSFKDKSKILNLTKGVYESLEDELVNVWLLDDITILLQYRIDPMFEFSLSVTKGIPNEIDRSSRKNGTIFEYLKTDFRAVFYEQENSKIPNVEEDGTISFVKYYYYLKPTEFNIFNQLEIQQSGSEKDYSFQKPTNLTFTSSDVISLVDMVETVEKLIKMYGSDDSGTEELEVHELDILEDRRNWTGRSWTFNEIHEICDFDNPNENTSYAVWISNDDYGLGFTLSIIGFNNLIKNFVTEE